MALKDRRRWYFTKEQLQTTPSRECGIDSYKELSYRQQSASFILEMGHRLKVSLLCINTAIVYMHRFYVFHSFTLFPGSSIAAAALFLAAKVEEQPRKLEHVIKAVLHCKRQDDIPDLNSERYAALSQELVSNENILLQTLGFEVAIDHPHTHVVKCCHLVKASKELAQTSYIIASNSLHLTMMCLMYSPTVVACFCIHFVCKWTNWEIPLSNEKKVWFSYVDETVTAELLEQLANEFLTIYDRCPNRLKAKITSVSDQNHGLHRLLDGVNAARALEASSGEQNRDQRDKKDFDRTAHHAIKSVHPNMPSTSGSSGNASSSSSVKHGSISHHHHHGHVPSSDAKLIRNVHQSSSSHTSSNVSRVDGREILRETVRNSRDQISNKDLTIPNRENVGNISSNTTNNSNHHVTRLSNSDKYNEYGIHQKHDVKFSASVNESVSSRAAPTDVNRRPIPSMESKLQQRQRDDHKPHSSNNNKLENDIKKHLNASLPEKSLTVSRTQSTNSSYSQRSKSPHAEFSKPTTHITSQSYKSTKFEQSSNHIEQPNGNLNFTSNQTESVKKSLDQQPQIMKRPGLFSPDPSPPKKKVKIESPPVKKELIKNNLELTNNTSSNGNRTRTTSNSSEPELRPVMKKIDHVEGFENIVRESSIGIKTNKAQDIEKKSDVQVFQTKETKLSDNTSASLLKSNNVPAIQNQPILNGIETNPTLISSLLKETPSLSFRTSTTNLPLNSEAPPILNDNSLEGAQKEIKSVKESHKEHKKNKKEKHKHKERERNKDEKEKKKKHREKEKHKHKKELTGADHSEAVPPVPIKITIDKKKMQSITELTPSALPSTSGNAGSLKIKIPKEKLKPEGISDSRLKIKISKDQLNMFIDRKKESDKIPIPEMAPTKVFKSNHSRHNDVKPFRTSYDKVRLSDTSIPNEFRIRPTHTFGSNNILHTPIGSNYLMYNSYVTPPVVPIHSQLQFNQQYYMMYQNPCYYAPPQTQPPPPMPPLPKEPLPNRPPPPPPPEDSLPPLPKNPPSF